jgi:hypothetical protein
MGPMAADFTISRRWRDARLAKIIEGTSEMIISDGYPDRPTPPAQARPARPDDDAPAEAADARTTP